MNQCPDDGFSIFLYGEPKNIIVGPPKYWVPRLIHCMRNLRLDRLEPSVTAAIDLGYCLDQFNS